MNTYFTSREIAHQWAHQLAPRGNCPSHEHFDGPSFYSYDTEIARIITRGKRKAYLLNTTSYSVTTSGHQSGVRAAIPTDVTVFEIGGQHRGDSLHDVTGAMLFDHAVKESAEAAAKLPGVRAQWKKDHLAGLQARWLKQAESVNEFFGLRRKVDTKAVERLAARVAADECRKVKAARDAQARREKEAQETIAKWLAGESVYFPHGVDRVYLRAILADADKFAGVGQPDTLETSRGVTVPLSEAKRAFKFAQKVRAASWRRNGETFKVGDFQLDAVSDAGIVAGCHRIDWPTADKFAKQQGWV